MKFCQLEILEFWEEQKKQFCDEYFICLAKMICFCFEVDVEKALLPLFIVKECYTMRHDFAAAVTLSYSYSTISHQIKTVV